MEPRKFIVGQRLQQFPGRTINSLIEAQRRAKSPNARPDPRTLSQHTSCNVVQLYWDGEDPLEPGSVVKLGEPMFLPADDESAPYEGLRFKAVEPTADDETGVLAITADGIETGDVGTGWMPNACWAQIDVQDDAHEFAVTQAGPTLKSSTTGRIPILWKPSGLTTPEKAWCIVTLQTSGSGGTTLISGDLIATIPPYSWVPDCVRLVAFGGTPTTNYFGWITSETHESGYETIGAVNRGPQTIRGSVALPTPVCGPPQTATVYTDETETETAQVALVEIIWSPFAGTSGHVTTPLSGLRQAPYHLPGTNDYTMDGGPCAE